MNCLSYLKKKLDLFNIQFCKQRVNIYKQKFT